jgi:polyhydroxyalkanoate synthase
VQNAGTCADQGRLRKVPYPLGTAFAAFTVADEMRRWHGRCFDVAVPRSETPFKLVLERPGVNLRLYGDRHHRPALLIVPAPIKKPYIWDLTPQSSVVRRCLDAGLCVYALEWSEPQPDDADGGLSTYADRLILECVDAIGEPVTLTGHSLGGTFAAIFASLHPERVRGLVLLEAPLSFRQDRGAIASLIRKIPRTNALRAAGSYPGTFLNALGITASPESFVWWRWRDWIASTANPDALRTHLLVERWTLDESAMPAGLFTDVVNLYQKDAFMRGTLAIGRRPAAASNVTAPVLAVVDPESDVVPPGAVLPFLDAIPSRDKKLLHYEGDTGVCLRHVGVLVGQSAHRILWPEILDWVSSLE